MKNRLKELRQERQWSQSDLARELGVSRQAINGFESGKFAPSLDMAFKLAALFNIPMEDIFVDEAKNSMQVIVEQVKNFFGFEFGFERFTEKAINAVKFAHNEAERLQSAEVEPEHLFVGLLADPTTTSAKLLQASSATLDIEINEHSFEFRGHSNLSREIKFVFELALQIVRLQGKKSIGTEHLLWGLIRLQETNQAELKDAFQDYGINMEVLNQQLLEEI